MGFMQSITRAPTVRSSDIGLISKPSIIKSSYPNSTASSFLIGRNAYQEAKTKRKTQTPLKEEGTLLFLWREKNVLKQYSFRYLINIHYS